MSINNDSTLRIIVVGLEGSGRRWFIQSLPRSIARHSSDPDFDYRIEDVYDKTDIRPILPSALETDEKMQDVVWRFQRIPRRGTYAHIISAHTHIFNVVSGDSDDFAKSFQGGGANFLFILLDPTKLSDFIALDTSFEQNLATENKGEKLTRAKYVEYVKGILDEVAFSSDLHWSVGVCVVKGDLLDNTEESWGLVRTIFGESMVLLFRQYKTRFSEIMPFRVSSFGYYLVDDERKPNPNPVLYDDVWLPEVASPFFWAFESVEKQRILQSADLITRLFFHGDRIKLYLHYPFRHNS